MVETQVKVGVEKVTHRKAVARQRRIEGLKTGTTRSGQWNALQMFGAMHVEIDMAEDRQALT